MNIRDFQLNPHLDVDALAAAYRSANRLHIPDFLDRQSAERLYRYLKEHGGWNLIFNQGEKLFEIDRTMQAEFTREQIDMLNLAVYRGARQGFQYRYENIRVPDSARERLASKSPLCAFARFLSTTPVLSLFKRITRAGDIGFADAQATAYGPGHFLTAHDDDVQGKNRRAAYVFNLSPAWSIDWGGLLMFHGADGHVDQGLVPTFNSLNLFTVPQPHSVSMVTPFSPCRRYSITGWLRAR